MSEMAIEKLERDETLLLQVSDREMNSLRSADHDSMSDINAPFARRSRRSVNVAWNMGLVLFLLIVAGVLGYVGYYSASSKEENAYRTAFTTDSQYLINNFYENALRTELEALSYAFQITASTKSAAYSWPFVSMAMEFEVVCFNMLRQSLATTAFFAPILTEDERLPWESFAAQTQPEILNISSTYRSIQRRNVSFEETACHKMKPAPPTFYSPIWHVAPRSGRTRVYHVQPSVRCNSTNSTGRHVHPEVDGIIGNIPIPGGGHLSLRASFQFLTAWKEIGS